MKPPKRLVKHNPNIFETPFTHLINFKIEQLK